MTVCRVGAEVYQWKGFRGEYTQKSQAGEMLWITTDIISIDAFRVHEIDQTITQTIGANTAAHGNPQPQPPRADSDVGGTATRVNAETFNLPQLKTDFVGVQIDGKPPHRKHIECP